MNGSAGLVHIYTGNGKGKTTAAEGLCVRACGAGMRVLFAQFLKGRDTSELEPLRRLGIVVRRTDPVQKFLSAMDEREHAECVESCRVLFEEASRAMAAGSFDLVVLDEVLDTVNAGILTEDELCAALTSRAPGVEVALTGRSPGKELCELADYISEIQALKHPYTRGVTARLGIEY